MATKSGIVKKTPVKEYENIRKTGLLAISLREDDELIEVKTTNNERDIFLVTKNGKCIRFNEQDVRPTGRSAMGVIGMTLTEDDEIVGMQLDSQGSHLLFVSEYGMGKRTAIDEFKVQHRGGMGVKCYKITEKTGNVVGVKAVNDDNEVMLITTEGIIIRLMVKDISIVGRDASGVKLISLDADSNITVASMAKVRENINANATSTTEELIQNMNKELGEDNVAIEPLENEDIESDASENEFNDEDFVKVSYEEQLTDEDEEDDAESDENETE